MNLKKKTKPGQCHAMRCKEADSGSGFCSRHAALVTTPTISTGDSIYDAGMNAGIAYVVSEEIEVTASEDGITIPRETIAVIKARIEDEARDVPDLVNGLDAIEISSDEEMAMVNEHLELIKKKKAAIDEPRKILAGPLDKILKLFNSWVRPATKALDNGEKILKAKISEALITARRAQDEALKEIEASGGEAVAEVLAVAHGQQLIQQPDNVSIIEKWDLEIVDPAAVPREFCNPDPVRLRAHAVATGGAAVAGVRFFKKQIVTQRVSRETGY